MPLSPHMPDVYDDPRIAAAAAGSKRPRDAASGSGDADAYYRDYYGDSSAADWYGGSDYYGASAPSAGGGGAAVSSRDGAGGRYKEEWDAYYRDQERRREWEERRDPYYRGGGGKGADWYGTGAGARDPHYDGAHRGAGYYDRHDQDARSASGSQRPNPLEGDTLLPFKHFVGHYKAQNPQATAAAAASAVPSSDGKAAAPDASVSNSAEPDLWQEYEKYRSEVHKRQMWKFFEAKSSEKWILERYSPDSPYADKRKERRRRGRLGKKALWIEELKQGKLDQIDFDLRTAPPVKGEEHDSKKQADANGEKEADAAEVKAEVKGEVKAEDTADDSEVKAKVEDIPDESDVRVDDEDDRERRGAPDANGEPVATDKKQDVAPAPMTDALLQRVDQSDLTNKPFLVTTRLGEEVQQGKECTIRPDPLQLIMTSLPPDLDRAELEAVFELIAAEHNAQFKYLAMNDPKESKWWCRIGYAMFEPGADMEAIRKAISSEKISGVTINARKSDRAAFMKIQILSETFGSARRLLKDLEQARVLLAKLEQEDRDDLLSATGASTSNGEEKMDGEEPKLPEVYTLSASSLIEERCDAILGQTLASAMEAIPEDAEVTVSGDELDQVRKIIKKHLDLHLDCLKEVYHCDYYHGCIRDYPEELVRKAPLIARRRTDKPLPEPKREALERDSELKQVDQRFAMLERSTELNIDELGGRSLQQELLDAALPYVKEEDAEKHRCTVVVEGGQQCGKLFKAPSFVQKHISNKHKAFLEDLAAPKIAKANYFNNYVLDPHRPMPLGGGSSAQHSREKERDRDREPANGARRPSFSDYLYQQQGGYHMGLPNGGMPAPAEMMAMMAQMMAGGMPQFDVNAMMQMSQQQQQGPLWDYGEPPHKRPKRGSSSGGGGGGGGGSLGARIGGRRGGGGGGGRGDRPPPSAAEPLPQAPRPLDPRASHGKRSYQDLDSIPDAAEKQIELEY